jgi:uncharacterized protein
VIYWSREATMLAPTLLALMLAAESPSFDCTKARTADEKLVCSEPDLARQDRELAAKYAAKVRQADPPAAAALKASQRAWLAERASCARARPEAAMLRCVQTSYEWRTADLDVPRRAPELPAGIVERRIVKRDPRAEEEVDVSYPALAPDRPAAAAFEAYFAKDAQARISRWRAEPRSTPPGSGSSIHASFTVPLSTARLVTVVTTGDTYANGAAHPLPFTAATTFDLDRGRPLTLEDVFAKGRKGAAALLPTARERLGDLSEEWESEETENARRVLADVSSWTFTADGAVVTFPPYSVAPYAAGSPEVRFTWAELKPHLKPDAPVPPR